MELPPPDTHCHDEDTRLDVWSYSPDLVRSIVAAAIAEERGAAANVCEAIGDEYQSREAYKWAEMKTDAQTGAHDCAAAIRARSAPRTQEE